MLHRDDSLSPKMMWITNWKPDVSHRLRLMVALNQWLRCIDLMVDIASLSIGRGRVFYPMKFVIASDLSIDSVILFGVEDRLRAFDVCTNNCLLLTLLLLEYSFIFQCLREFECIVGALIIAREMVFCISIGSIFEDLLILSKITLHISDDYLSLIQWG